MENFFRALKRKIYHGYVYRSQPALDQTIDRFIRYYNNDPIKEKLGMSPKQYRKRMQSE